MIGNSKVLNCKMFTILGSIQVRTVLIVAGVSQLFDEGKLESAPRKIRRETRLLLGLTF